MDDEGDGMNAHYADWEPENPYQQRPKPSSLKVIDVGAWEGHIAPPRPWIVEEWLPSRAVTLLAGKGGTGKSLLVQQLLSCLSTGDLFMGVRGVTPVRCLYVNCEDPADELWRRQEAIARTSGRRMKSYKGSMFISPRLGEADNSLGRFSDTGAFIGGDLLNSIRATAKSHDCRVIALDNVAHLYSGNENARSEVTAFCSALSALALEIDGAVILVAHPAKKDDSEFSGSTAWENAVRNRLFLDRPKDGDDNQLENRRTLSRSKSNLASIGDKLKMVYHAGAFHPPGGVIAEEARDAVAEAAFLACLDRKTAMGVNVSESVNARDKYAPRVFAAMPEAAGVGQKALEAAMNRLFNAGEIIVDHELWKGKQRKPVRGIARAKQCAQSRAKPAPSGAPSVRRDRAETAPSCAPTPLYPTDISGGAARGPASEQDYEMKADLRPVPDDPGYWAMEEAELMLVPDYAPGDQEPELPEPWI